MSAGTGSSAGRVATGHSGASVGGEDDVVADQIVANIVRIRDRTGAAGRERDVPRRASVEREDAEGDVVVRGGRQDHVRRRGAVDIRTESDRTTRDIADLERASGD